MILVRYPMGHTTTHPRSFGQKLRAELDRREWGVRTLARAMANRDNTPARVDSLRRQLKRYLSETAPVTPTPGTRRAIEAAMELEDGALKADTDDDEEDVLEALRPLALLLSRAGVSFEVPA